MKTIDKKSVMKRAWQLHGAGGVRKYLTYKTSCGTVEEQSYLVKEFSECLRRAWEIEKETLTNKSYDMNELLTGMADTISAAYSSGCYTCD